MPRPSNLPIGVYSIDGGELFHTDNPKHAVAGAVTAINGGEKGVTFKFNDKWVTTVTTEVGARLALRLLQNAQVGIFSSDFEKGGKHAD